MAEIDVDFEPYPDGAEWLKQDYETERAYAAFCVYRDAGALRSLRDTAKKFYNLPDRPGRDDPKVRQVKLWSSENDWGARALAFQSHMDKLSRIEHVEAVRTMHKRHAATAMTAVKKAAEKILALDSNRLTAREATMMLDVATRIERMARGLASEIVETIDPVVSADQSLRELLTTNPAAAIAARDLSLHLSAAESAIERAADGLTPTPPEPPPATEPPAAEEPVDDADGPT